MRTVIIEDETAAALNLHAMLGAVCPEARVLATLESVTEAVEWFGSGGDADLVFMDIHLADGDAFRIFERVEIPCPVVFTTAYDRYALEAFKVNSIDYLLKPITEADLRRALDKLHRLSGAERHDYGRRIAELASERSAEVQRVLLVHVRDRIIPLHAEQIAFCYTCEERVTAYGFDGERYPLDKTLETLSSMLPPSDFFRANRQFIVSRKALKDISVWFGSRLALNLTLPAPERIVISKARVPEFKRWLTSVDRP